MKKLYPRWQEKAVSHALKTRRIIMLAGARQCGKTTLARQLVSEETNYRTLDDIILRESAESDPESFVKHTSRTLIIDEIQRVPALLPPLKKAVDLDTRTGQYLITGSANIQNMPSAMESLAGRLTKIRLRPLSQGEIKGTSPTFLTHAFHQSFDFKWDFVEKDILIEMAFRGGVPEALTFEERDRKKWYWDYITTLLERDLRDIAKIQSYGVMRDLIKILAAWSSKLMDISSISSGLSVGRATIASYINALETLYIIERVYPWIKTDYERVGVNTR